MTDTLTPLDRSPWQSNPASKTITFTGASGFGANGTASSLFTVSGGLIRVLAIAGRVTTSVTVSNVLATISLGVTGQAALFIPLTVGLNVTGLLSTTPIWASTTPTAGGILLPAITQNTVIASNVIATIGGTGDISTGVIEFNIIWQPLTPNALLVAA